MNDAISVARPRQYQPVNCCIYCGENQAKLQNEHILMYGLGGKEVLPKSSCSSCAQITGQVEQFVARDMWGGFRAAVGMVSRKKVPLTEYAFVVRTPGAEVMHKVMLPVGKLPAYLVLPILPVPVFFTKTPIEKFDTWSAHINRDEMKNLHGDRFYIGAIDLQIFSRFLAKTAHAFVTAQIGHGSFKPLLLDAIAGRHPRPADFVGSYTQPPEKSADLHFMEIVTIDDEGSLYVGARIRLFAGFGAPEYVVVVGSHIEASATEP